MKNIITSIALTLASFTSFGIVQRTETIHIDNSHTNTNSLLMASSGSKDVTIRLLAVPEIYEIRDIVNVERHMSLTNYENDVLMKKLLPQQIVPNLDECDTNSPFARFDTHDIVVNELDIDYPSVWLDPAYIDIHSLDVDMYAINPMQVKSLNVEVNQSIFDFLDNLRSETLFNDEYRKYGKSEYLRDLDALDQHTRWQWINILKQNARCNIQLVRSSTKRKIIAEARYVKDYNHQTLTNNLNSLKTLGYDAVLVRFDTTEDLSELLKLANEIKDNGFVIYFTYVGLDNLKPSWNPFCNAYRLTFFLEEISLISEGMFLNWRGTSSHVKLLPIEFFNFLCNTARNRNQNLLIYGEVYYGQISYLRETKVVATIPTNVTGIMIDNMGYAGYNHAYIVNKLFSKVIPNYGRMEKIGLVIGYAPYYCSKKNLNFSLSEEYKHKQYVENAFRKVNCSTITFLHDGIDDNYVLDKIYDTTDNILEDIRFSQSK